MEDLQEALSDRGLTVSTLPEKGRCLLSIRDFSPGDVVFSEEPYVSVPNKTSVDFRCDGCYKSSNLKKCSACQVVWYCGNKCQKSDWKLHRLECRALLKLDKERLKSLTPSIRLMVKLYLRKKLQSEKIIPTTATDNYYLVEALVSHMSDIDEKQLVLYAQMANLVNLILQLPEINIKEIAEIFSKLACNAHTISDCELRPLGTGLYPIVSIINHSCLPNSVLVFDGKLAIVRAVQHIPKGTEVLISYIETAGSTMTRQKVLKEQYFFACTCLCCMKLGKYDDIQESAILEGYGCKNSGCTGFLLRDSGNRGFICQQCGLVRDKEEIKAIASEMKSMSDKASILLSSKHLTNLWLLCKNCLATKSSMDVIEELITGEELLDDKDVKLYNMAASSMYKMIETLQEKLYHSFSINLMRTRETLLKICMEVQDWSEALAYCRLTIPVYQRVYPGFHPLLGLQYYTCGKLEWLVGDTEDAVKSLTKAVDILRITHGTNTPFMKDLLLKLEEARAEASYKFSSLDESPNSP